jgi:hypothetical protein
MILSNSVYNASQILDNKMNESNYIHLYSYFIFIVIYISNNDTIYHTLNILFLTMITISILCPIKSVSI